MATGCLFVFMFFNIHGLRGWNFNHGSLVFSIPPRCPILIAPNPWHGAVGAQCSPSLIWIGPESNTSFSKWADLALLTRPSGCGHSVVGCKTGSVRQYFARPFSLRGRLHFRHDQLAVSRYRLLPVEFTESGYELHPGRDTTRCDFNTLCGSEVSYLIHWHRHALIENNLI